MLLLMGDLVQVMHFVLIAAVSYFVGRGFFWVGPVWCGVVIISNSITGGMCPVTVFSNTLLKAGGGQEFPSLHDWTQNYTGTTFAITIAISSLLVPLIIGLYFNPECKEIVRTALNNRRKSVS